MTEIRSAHIQLVSVFESVNLFVMRFTPLAFSGLGSEPVNLSVMTKILSSHIQGNKV